MFEEIVPVNVNLTYQENWAFVFKLRSNLKGWPEQMAEAKDWCSASFGAGGKDRWGSRVTTICFHDPRQAFLFKMRWC